MRIGGATDAPPCALWAPAGPNGEVLLFLKCDQTGYEVLLQSAANIYQEVTGESGAIEVDYDTFPSMEPAFLANGWGQVLVMRATVQTGPFAGIMAYGTGGNIKVRRRTARLAAAVAALCSRGPASGVLGHQDPALRQLLQEVQHSTQVDPDDYPPAAAAAGAWPDQGAGPDAYALPPDAYDQQPAADSIPQELRDDPFCELRQWPTHGGGFEWWPFCTECNVWSDPNHIVSKKHLRKLESMRHVLGVARNDIVPYSAAQASAAPAHLPWSSRPPAQTYESAPPPPPPQPVAGWGQPQPPAYEHPQPPPPPVYTQPLSAPAHTARPPPPQAWGPSPAPPPPAPPPGAPDAWAAEGGPAPVAQPRPGFREAEDAWAQQPAVPEQPMRSAQAGLEDCPPDVEKAPDPPSLDDIFDWSYEFVSFPWDEADPPVDNPLIEV